MKSLDQSKEWESLKQHQKLINKKKIWDLFKDDPQRFQHFSLQFKNILFDFSKNLITQDTLTLLHNLALCANLPQKIEELFSAKIMNITEKKPALHTALRSLHQSHLYVEGVNIMEDVRSVINKMRIFTDKIRQQAWLGVTGKPIKHIVNIGIGGSHLGPLMATHGLAPYAMPHLKCHFVSNVDSAHLVSVLNQIDPAATLFIISSKSFTTLETITNAHTLIRWFKKQLNTENISAHFVAVTAAPDLAIEFGIQEANVFPLWNWVGGRYSIWSAVGLPLAILIGMDAFLEFLEGAEEMDNHFRYTPFLQNMPVIMGLLGVWYINFFNSTHHAIVPYSHYLNYFRMYIQQLDMESNGKNISIHGDDLSYPTCPVIFGDQGCNGQHAFHQLLHQGKHFIPVDFILTGKEGEEFNLHHDILVASALSQSQALMRGKSQDETMQELKALGFHDEECEFLAKHKAVPGNRPSNTIFLDRITPYTLGLLIALYEHKTFVQGIIWGVNSFDQWGVELGKNLLPSILSSIHSSQNPLHSIDDASTVNLINYYKKISQ